MAHGIQTTWHHVKREKGIGFIPGSDDVPETVRTTAWEFMGQKVPPNYGKLVFVLPLAKECDFGPTMDYTHGLTAESSTQRDASAQGSEPMRNPYEQPSRRSGDSTQRETPDDQWEQQRSSSGSSEPPQDDPCQNYRPTQDAQDNQQEEPMADTDDDPMGGEVVDLWEAEEPPDDDYVVEQATKHLFLHQIPGSFMKLVSFVHVMRMVRSSRMNHERRSLSSENGIA